jgi:hypothetical protein
MAVHLPSSHRHGSQVRFEIEDSPASELKVQSTNKDDYQLQSWRELQTRKT